MRRESSGGKEGCAIASLKVRWGSGVKRHIVVVGRVLSECGRWILPGLSRFWSTMCFLVVTTSQIGSAELEVTSSEQSSAGSASRFFVVEEASFCFAFDLMCLRSAVEALRVWELLMFPSAMELGQTYLRFIKLIWRSRSNPRRKSWSLRRHGKTIISNVAY